MTTHCHPTQCPRLRQACSGPSFMGTDAGTHLLPITDTPSLSGPQWPWAPRVVTRTQGREQLGKAAAAPPPGRPHLPGTLGPRTHILLPLCPPSPPGCLARKQRSDTRMCSQPRQPHLLSPRAEATARWRLLAFAPVPRPGLRRVCCAARLHANEPPRPPSCWPHPRPAPAPRPARPDPARRESLNW